MSRGVFKRTSAVLLMVGAGIALAACPAGAKLLPVTSVDVVTPKPTVGRPVDIIVRMRPPFDLGDFAWENFEISVLPSREISPHGWPYAATFRGTAVRLHRVAKGTYRGSVTFRAAGNYVVVDWSHVYAGDAHRAQVENKTDYLAPVPLHVAAVSPTTTAEANSSSPRTAIIWSAAAVLLALAATSAVRLRSRRRVVLGQTRASHA